MAADLEGSEGGCELEEDEAYFYGDHGQLRQTRVTCKWTHVLQPNRDSSQAADLLVNLEDVRSTRGALLQHSTDEALNRVGVGGIRWDLRDEQSAPDERPTRRELTLYCALRMARGPCSSKGVV